MTPEMVIDIGKEAGMVVVLLAAPPLLTALTIGLLVGMIQAATQIQEMTLSFIPKLLGIGVALVVAGHWMLRLVTEYTIRLYHSVPDLIG